MTNICMRSSEMIDHIRNTRGLAMKKAAAGHSYYFVTDDGYSTCIARDLQMIVPTLLTK